MTKKITGKDLIDLGYQPGRWFGQALNHINRYQLYGEELSNYLDQVIPKEIPPHEQPVSFHSNIAAETEDEVSNIQSVRDTMQEVMKTPTVVDGAIMPDACPAGPRGTIPVGGVIATKNAIHPAMHSADICCSVMMTNLGQIQPKKVMDLAMEITHFGWGGRQNFFPLEASIVDRMRSNDFLKDEKSRQLAQSHLGTQGDGNHFLFVGQSESTGDTIVVTHHGSRGLGSHLYKKGLLTAEKFRKEISPQTRKINAWIPFDDDLGKEYWEALQIIRSWTKLNHQSIHREILRATNAQLKDHFWNEHNFVFKDGDIFYHAKGATPLLSKFVPDALDDGRLIPLNMSQPILIVKGAKTETNLGFAPHGAGRNISRSQHIRRNSDRNLQELFLQETDGLDIRFYSGHIDISELPSAYKNAETVQKQMKKFDLGTIDDQIVPYGSIMAGNWKKDAPWKKKR